MGESILTFLEWIHVSIGLFESGVDVSIDICSADRVSGASRLDHGYYIWSGFSGSGVYVRISFSVSGVDVSIGFYRSGVDM